MGSHDMSTESMERSDWKFVSLEANEFFRELHKRPFIQECGFDSKDYFKEEFWGLFYANLKFSKPHAIIVRGRMVRISPSIISEFYNMSHYENEDIEILDLGNFHNVDLDNIILYLTKGKGK
ncbi:hypothetical protein Golob_021992 [Gossypium lobatum]|uniref:Uncharacterized protein n=1 Tax=Gossypium lobatum TaxID=34289 RepID=A0A7J8LF86_9ROSI|nr:hypothetical protein [Gossypium lobatum]